MAIQQGRNQFRCVVQGPTIVKYHALAAVDDILK
jgi:hypothetical protein